MDCKQINEITLNGVDSIGKPIKRILWHVIQYLSSLINSPKKRERKKKRFLMAEVCVRERAKEKIAVHIILASDKSL